MRLFRHLTLLAACCFIYTAHAQEDTVAVPNTFEANSPAVAADVNGNFNYLAEQLQLVRDKAFDNVVSEGAVRVQVNCAENPFALRESYRQYINYREIEITVDGGSCYGDFMLVDDGTGQSTYQAKNQTVSLFAPNGASIVPHPTTQRVNLFAGFGGGLYINNFEIQAGENDRVAILFSRNAHGSLSFSTLTGSNSTRTLVQVQEGSQLYVSSSELETGTFGAMVLNGGLLRFIGDVLVRDVTTGILASSGRVKNDSELTISADAERDSITLNGASSWLGDYGAVTIEQGAAFINTSSSFVENIVTTSTPTYFRGATGEIKQFDGPDVYVERGSSLKMSNARVRGVLQAQENAVVTLEDSEADDVHIIDGGLIKGNVTVNNNVDVTQARIDLSDATVNGNMVLTDSQFSFYKSAINSPTIRLQSARGDFSESRSINLDALECQGLSAVYADGADLLIDYPDTGCMNSYDYGDLADIIRQSRQQ